MSQLKVNRCCGMAARLTPGDEMDFKIKTPSDLQIFRSLVDRERKR